MNILVFHQPFPMGNYKVNETVAKHFKNKGHKVYYVEQLNGAPVSDEYIEAIKQLEPDLVYYEMLDRETFKVVEHLNCEKILLYASKGILNSEKDIPQYKGKWYTKIITNAPKVADYFKSEGIPTDTFEYYFSSLIDEELVYKPEYNHDCVFLGMGHARLTDPYYKLERDTYYGGFQEFDFKIYGSGWPNWPHYAGILPENDVGSLYCSVKSSVSQIGTNQRNNGQINGRYSEIMFANCPLLSYNYPTINWYGAEKHIIFIESRQDMIEKVLDIKKNPDKYKENTIALRKFIENQTTAFFVTLDNLIKK